MNVFTVSLFGHREVSDLILLEKRLIPLLKNILDEQQYTSFLIGRNGEFDTHSASIIKQIGKNIEKESYDINLVLPYRVADIDCYEKYYDSIIIPDTLHKVHFKAAITLRNKWMIENSDLIIAYVEHNTGGAYNALKYAKKLGKTVINLCDAKNEEE